ncbi:MAG: hypothetical protein KAU20_02485 [Nanoarchaeota archaeon]|nr:hypothetical protein [Nanoarchaeota archaeon]
MSQTAYNRNLNPSFAGMKADSRFDTVESFIAGVAIAFGLGVSGEKGETRLVVIPKNDNAKLVFDADFVDGNAINGKVNGVDWIEVDWDTDHDTTAAALAAEINSMAGVTCILDPLDASNKTYLIETVGQDASVTDVAVTGGISQAGSTVTYSADDEFRGIAITTGAKEQILLTGVTEYKANEAVSVLRRGMAWAETSKAVTADDDAYVDMDQNGKFTNVSTDNMTTGGKFRSSVAAAGLALLELNIP